MKARSGADQSNPVDILVIGGGVNGAGIARDAAGRGLSVILCEKGDLAGATSSASTKLFHGGLRYLEYFEFGLVREALIEREILLKSMPHIAFPMRFVLPIDEDLRFPEHGSSFARLMSIVPFLGGRRPSWLTRTGLFLYDHLGGRENLPPTETLDLRSHPAGRPLKSLYTQAFEYSDGWVDDARLVVLCARDAANRGATILTRTRLEKADREGDLWRAELRDTETDTSQTIYARALVNAAGPWVEDVLHQKLRQISNEGVRLVRGSHIVTRRLFDHDQPYFFQLADGRIIFAIPFQTDFTLIGTTEREHQGDPGNAVCTDEEKHYLVNAINNFFRKQIGIDDIVWTYSGVRPLYDDHADDATSATRDYVLTVSDEVEKAPLLNVFGGKITTFRHLSEEAMHRLRHWFPEMASKWTADARLPGGDFEFGGARKLTARLREKFSFLDGDWAMRLIRAYGTDAFEMLDGAGSASDLGQSFGATLTAREVDWMVNREWARTADDILWRRSKLGLRIDDVGRAALSGYLHGLGTV
ncbi:MAG: glycerol-3-phosphate dehydrogenase [Hyphomicrobiaceae bacterium]|nr:glycerol-3-phosphate dehydrogenase [Hyphomicrobiaceae bacterium]MCC0024447.1 glycerol-3-phosphate dehydrogenase [Hyphomicrobiaceae bacterium]